MIPRCIVMTVLAESIIPIIDISSWYMLPAPLLSVTAFVVFISPQDDRLIPRQASRSQPPSKRMRSERDDRICTQSRPCTRFPISQRIPAGY